MSCLTIIDCEIKPLISLLLIYVSSVRRGKDNEQNSLRTYMG